MKQRTHLMHSPEELISFGMNSSNKQDPIQLHKIRPQDRFIEAQVNDGDTLQAISLRFHCSIAELKRINHMDKDNEIFARRIIKVPVTPYSLLTEIIPARQEESTPSTSTNTPTHIVQGLDNNTNYNQLQSLDNSGNNESNFPIDCNAVVMNSTVAPSIIPYTDEITDGLSEDTQLLPNKERVPVETVVVKQLTSQGADFGIKWFHLVCCLLILCVALPIVYVMFYLDKHEHSDVPPLHSLR